MFTTPAGVFKGLWVDRQICLGAENHEIGTTGIEILQSARCSVGETQQFSRMNCFNFKMRYEPKQSECEIGCMIFLLRLAGTVRG